jgi:hypothetical protein
MGSAVQNQRQRAGFACVTFHIGKRNRWTCRSPADSESLLRANRPERARGGRIRPGRSDFYADNKGKAASIRTLRGWAISVLQAAGAIRECEEHGWMQDRADPHARERALEIAGQAPPSGLSPAQAVTEIRDVLDSIGDTCPDCPPDDL